MNKQLAFIFLLSCFFACQQPNSSQNTSPEQEEWIALYNDKDFSNWDIKITGYDINDNYNETFVAEDSMIRISYDKYEEFDDAFGHMYYKTPYSYYKLRFDYRFVGEQTKGGASWNVRNSGIMFHSQSAESNEYNQTFPVSVELQLLGGLGERDRTTANVCTPGTAVVMGDTVNYTHCISSTSKTYHGDQWVHAEAIVMGGEYMTFIVEGDTVLTFQMPQIGGGFVSNKVDDWERVGGIKRDKEMWIAEAGEVLTEGYIALQAESHPIDFKNLELLDLCGCMDKKAKNYKSYFVKNVPEKCMY